MIKEVILIRHSESLKNIRDLFGDEKTSFNITKKGKIDSIALAGKIQHFLGKNNTNHLTLLTSPDLRSFETTKIVSETLGCEFNVIDTLLPIKAGELSGISENEAKILYPELMKRKQLFRDGILNGYEISYPGGEDVRQFQERIMVDFFRIINLQKSLFCIISHQSVITAILSFFNAKINNIHYYYYYKLDLCGLSKITINDDYCQINFVNQ